MKTIKQAVLDTVKRNPKISNNSLIEMIANTFGLTYWVAEMEVNSAMCKVNPFIDSSWV